MSALIEGSTVRTFSSVKSRDGDEIMPQMFTVISCSDDGFATVANFAGTEFEIEIIHLFPA